MAHYNGLFLYNTVNFTSRIPDGMHELENAYSVHALLEKVFDTFSVLAVNLKNLPNKYKKPRKNKGKIRKNKIILCEHEYFFEEDGEIKSDEEKPEELILLENGFAGIQILFRKVYAKARKGRKKKIKRRRIFIQC